MLIETLSPLGTKVWINPQHLLTVISHDDAGSCTITLTTGETWILAVSADDFLTQCAFGERTQEQYNQAITTLTEALAGLTKVLWALTQSLARR